jgi:hypothetical protein
VADTKISALTAATAAAGANELPINEAGTTKKLTVDNIRDYCGCRYVNLTADATANSTTTAARITNMDATSVGAGNYAFTYFIRYVTSITTTGVKFSVNHTGTLTFYVANMRYASTGGAAATAAATQAGNTATGNIHESFSARAKSTAAGMGPTVSADTTGDMLVIIEGSFLVTATGTLELYHASETAASTTVKAGTGLILHRLGT